MLAWDQVPKGHRGRDYEYRGALVRCGCVCRWFSTWARDLVDARTLWMIHVRGVIERRRP